MIGTTFPFARPAAVLLLALSTLPALAAPCVDEDHFDATPATESAGAPAPDPRAVLVEMVQQALKRSQSVGAARLAAEAAQQDVEEARAGKAVQASIGGSLGPGSSQSGLAPTETAALQGRATLSVSQLLYDGGRVDRLTDWRTQLAESARYGTLTQQEQVAASTVALALDRSRYRLQVQVYRQYARKMACLVQALDTIVRADRGRASELVQAQKSLQQAELSVAQAQSQARQVEVRLRRLVGDGLPPIDGLTSLLLTVPDLARLQAEVPQAADIEQLGAQVNAAERYAQSVQASGKPQISWTLGATRTTASGGNVAPGSTARSSSLALGLMINIPLLNPGVDAASDAATKRAQALALQREDAVQNRLFRMAEVYEQTQSAFDRARRTAAVLRDSDLVRNYTLQQWQQLGRRSLFDVMAAESEHYNLRVAYVDAIHDGQQLNAILLSLGRGVNAWLR